MGTFSHVHFNAMSGAGVAAQAILSNEKESLRWERAHDILSQEESYVQCVVPPVRPKSGEVFLYHALDASKRSKLYMTRI